MKNIALRLISSSVCSVRRLIQNLRFRLLSLLSRLWRWRIMFLVLISFSCFILLVFSLQASEVSASPCDIAQATSTFHPMFPSSTPGLDPLDCGTGTPVGWGTVTPNPAWMALCAHCMPTGSAFPTWTPVWSPTVVATTTGTPATATPSVTVTATPYAYITCHPVQGGGLCSQYDPYTIYGSFSGTTTANSGDASFPAYIHANYLPIGSTIYITVTNLSLSYVNSYIDRLYYYSFSENGNGTWTNLAVYANGLSFPGGSTILSVQAPPIKYYSVVVGGPNNSWKVGPSAAHSGVQGTYTATHSMTIYLSTSGYINPVTPTPTPAPSDTYCSVVDGGAGSCDDGTSSFCLPDPIIGEPVCGSGGGFIIPFSWFNIIGFDLDDVVVPKIEMCFAPVMIGHLILADFDIDLDVVVFALCALLLFWLVKE